MSTTANDILTISEDLDLSNKNDVVQSEKNKQSSPLPDSLPVHNKLVIDEPKTSTIEIPVKKRKFYKCQININDIVDSNKDSSIDQTVQNWKTMCDETTDLMKDLLEQSKQEKNTQESLKIMAEFEEKLRKIRDSMKRDFNE